MGLTLVGGIEQVGLHCKEAYERFLSASVCQSRFYTGGKSLSANFTLSAAVVVAVAAVFGLR
jgi:hypothetical protein